MAEAEPVERSARTDALWARMRVDPVEIALPGGVGYTLRAYRLAADVAAAQVDPASADRLDDFDAAAAAVLSRRRAETSTDDDLDDDDLDDDDDDLELAGDHRSEPDRDGADQDGADQDDDDQDDQDDEAAETGEEEVPVFLGRKGRLYLFHSPEKLVEFVRSGAAHDLAQLDTWAELVGQLRAEHVVAADEDTYELDLVVQNLRAGPDAWDPTLILKAGEVARDLGYALRIEAVRAALAPGSPLDELDEALRAAEAGGVGGFLARRRLRRVPAQQSSLAWRTLIGKISAVADWRD